MNFFSHTSSASCLSKTGLPRVTYLKLDANVQAPWNVVKSQSAQVCRRMDEDCKGSLLDQEENEKGHLVQSLCWESEAQLTFHTHTHTHIGCGSRYKLWLWCCLSASAWCGRTLMALLPTHTQAPSHSPSPTLDP